MTDSERPDPEQLIRQVRRGGADLLGPLLEMYREYLVLLARLRMGPAMRRKLDASDIVQETFAKASRQFADFEGSTEAELAAWLRRILARKLANAIRHHRRQRRDWRLERSLEGELDRSSHQLAGQLEAAGSSPSQRVSRREEGVLLSDALAELREDYREVLVLRNLEGHSFPEVARLMGRSLDSVKNLWTRAILQMRTKISHQAP